MKIGLVAACPFFVDRGTPIRIDGIARGLRSHDHDVRVVTYHLGRNPSDVPYEIERIVNLPFYSKTTPGPHILKPIVDSILFVKSFRVFQSWEPDCIIGSHIEGGFLAAILKKFLRIPMIYDAHASFANEMQAFNAIPDFEIAKLPFEVIEQFILRSVDACLPTSENLRQKFHQTIGSEQPIMTIPGGVTLKNFENANSKREELNLPGRHYIVAYAGNLAPYQGVEILLEAANKTPPDVHFLIVGGPKKRLVNKAEELGVSEHCTFTGQVPARNIPDYLKTADCLVSPRRGSKTEGQLASKVIPYLAAGKPILATNIEPHNVLEHQKTALLFEDGSVEELVDYIERIKTDTELSETLQKNARNKAKEFDWRSIAEDILAAIRKLTEINHD